MGVLSHLEPREVFQYFEEICRIPHGSGHTQQISDYLVHFAKDQELKWQQDESGNVMIWKDGTAGYEQAPAAMLQGHIDMVCEKDPGCPLDMEKDPLMLREDGGMVTAEGTTLGGDDGIAVAYALTILASDSIPHPPLEAVFTVDEEIGMLGAAALDASLLKARYLLNIDSEDEGILLAGCAGGATAECSIPVKHAIFGGSEAIIKVEKGLGGHSGVDINRGRANASQVLGRALKALSEEADFRIVRIEGGKKDNAIPASSSAQLIVSGDAQIRQLIALIGRLNMALEKEYSETDPDIRLTISVDQDVRTAMGADAFDEETTSRVVEALCRIPFGVQKMNPDIPGLVQTSLNLGILKTEERMGEASEVSMSISVRSSVKSEKDALLDELKQIMEKLGGSMTLSGDYPAWEYQKDSCLRDLMVEVFKEQYGHEPIVTVIHAGLECGLFADKMPGIDIVSFGPEMTDIHTPRESMDVASVQRTWEFLLEVLKRLK